MWIRSRSIITVRIGARAARIYLRLGVFEGKDICVPSPKAPGVIKMTLYQDKTTKQSRWFLEHFYIDVFLFFSFGYFKKLIFKRPIKWLQSVYTIIAIAVFFERFRFFLSAVFFFSISLRTKKKMTSIELDHSVGFSGYVTNHLSYVEGNQDKEDRRYMYAAGGSLVVSNFGDVHKQVSALNAATHSHILTPQKRTQHTDILSRSQ